jgi:betaine-aldehyde dehydrogenase
MNAQHWIAGTWTGTPTQPAIDPATGEPIGLYADGGAAEADAAIAAARAVFDRTTWAQDARLRQNVLLDWATALDAKREELAMLMARENGKAIAQARGEIAAAISEVRYYAGLARHLPGHVLEPEPGTISTMLREAAGVAAIIVPWNAPAVLLVRSLAPALAAGCTSVVKPAAQTSLRR